jgi:putative addiction module CopG family antidote
MDIILTPALQAFVEEQVRTGHYKDASEVVCDALRRVWIDHNVDSPILEEMLLEAVEGPHEPLTRETLDSICRQSLSEGPR